MRFERALLVVVLASSGCDEKPEGPSPERFASVKKKADPRASAFCEKIWAAGEKQYPAPQLRAFGTKVERPKGWVWVNLWATWCKPCVEEMGLLLKWSEAFEREQLPVAIELLSVDEGDADLDGWMKKKTLPGHVSWVASTDETQRLLEGLGLDKGTAIPVHVLVDPAGDVRCVRVGAINPQSYGAVRALISGG